VTDPSVLTALAGRDSSAETQRLRADVSEPFDLARLAAPRSPLVAGTVDFATAVWPHRINQCLVKAAGSEVVEFGPFASQALDDFVTRCIGIANDLDLDWGARYLYATVDTAPVVAGETQRQPGWHFDDLQGADISPKRPGGFLFVAVSSLPTEFAIQSFDMTGADENVHNLFDWCGRQVTPATVAAAPVGGLLVLSAYDVHRAVPAVHAGPRVFLRLLFTHCALTSRKTTLNPAMTYDHVPHSTSGAIPHHLV
jgi:hypothetical protein